MYRGCMDNRIGSDKHTGQLIIKSGELGARSNETPKNGAELTGE